MNLRHLCLPTLHKKTMGLPVIVYNYDINLIYFPAIKHSHNISRASFSHINVEMLCKQRHKALVLFNGSKITSCKNKMILVLYTAFSNKEFSFVSHFSDSFVLYSLQSTNSLLENIQSESARTSWDQ